MNAGTRVPSDLPWLGRLTLLGCFLWLGACGKTDDGGSGVSGVATGESGNGGQSPVGEGGTSSAVTTGGTAGTAGQPSIQQASEPVDDRPPRPAWNPSFPLGSAGWRQSTEPLCEKNQGWVAGLDVWADQRGVFVLFDADCLLDPGYCAPGKNGASLKFNDGTGWQNVYQFGPSVGSLALLSGFPDGPLILAGGTAELQYGVVFVEEGVATFEARLFPGVVGAFGVGKDLAYAVGSDPADSTISEMLRYSAGTWSTTVLPTDVGRALWADDQTLVLAGGNQTIYMQTATSGNYVQLSGVPAGNYYSVWAFGPQDVWAGNSAGELVHYDGNSWQVYPTGSSGGISALWGANGQVYFTTTTQHEVGRWNGQTVETLLTSGEVATVTDLWGRSSSEVFVTLHDYDFEGYACGGSFILWFDGTEWHQF